MKYMSKLEKWFLGTVGDDSINAVSSRSGIPAATLWRQAPGNIAPENVAKIARAYDASVIDGLIAQGLLHPQDVDRTLSRDALASASDEDLIQEMADRIKQAPQKSVYNKPISEVSNLDK